MALAADTVTENFEAATSVGPIDDVTLIEERVDTGLDALMESYEPKSRLDTLPLDMVGEYYRIDVHSPLPHLDTTSAKAYAAHHIHHPDIAVYALICDSKSPARGDALEALKGMKHAQGVMLLEHATSRISYLNENRQALICTRPKGQRLSERLREGVRFNEHQVIDLVLRPIVDILLLMNERQISHGRINPDNIFIDERITLGECLSEVPGVSQPYLYEPIERSLCDTFSKGSPSDRTDAYALAMLAYELLYGLEPLRKATQDEYNRLMIEKGTFHVLSLNREFNEQFTDFFRGTLVENKQERWGLEQVRNWLGGKRYNLIHPSLPSEASRPITINERPYYSRRSLAFGISRHWMQMAKDLRTAKLDRWLETSIHASDCADKVSKVIRNCGGESTRNERHNNEMNAKLIIAMDPNGPIRMKDIAFNVDGTGASLCHYLLHNRQAELNQLIDAIEFDLPGFWSDMSSLPKLPSTTNTLWRMGQIRSQIRLTTIGYGIERALYDLNQGLPCQSALLLPYHLTTADGVLHALDTLAKTHHGNSLLDRHVAAFLASRIEMAKEISFENLSRLPKLKNHPELMAIRILSLAQEKVGRPRLVGLSTWAAMRLDALIDNIHNRGLRKKLKGNLKKAAATGLVSYVLAVLVDNVYTRDDYNGFTKASAIYQINLQRIDGLQNPKALSHMAHELGGRFATFVAYIILGITCYILLNQYYL